jgi:hypothetical protein
VRQRSVQDILEAYRYILVWPALQEARGGKGQGVKKRQEEGCETQTSSDLIKGKQCQKCKGVRHRPGQDFLEAYRNIRIWHALKEAIGGKGQGVKHKQGIGYKKQARDRISLKRMGTSSSGMTYKRL